MSLQNYSAPATDNNHWARPTAHPLAELIDRRQWVAHENKRPIDPNTGRAASTTDPVTWGTYDMAVAMVTVGRANGIGFVFTPDDPYSGIDVDGCRNAETGEIDARGRGLIDRFPGIYWEISLSGTGLHGIGRGVLPDDAGGRHPKGIGIFDRTRFFVTTGHVLPGHESLGDFGDELIALYQDVAPAPPERHASPAPTLPLDDHDLCERLTHEAGGKGSRLLAGDRAGYPDFSSARFALATKASFYSDDVDQIAQVIRSSGLFKDGDSERERDRKALVDARQAVTSYSGPRYNPTYRNRSTRHTDSPAPLHADTTTPHDTAWAVPPDSDAQSCSDQLRDAHARITELEVTIARQAETISTLQERVRLADEREAIQRNTKLGASRQTGAALATLFREERPKEPSTPTPYRMPLAKLAERTGLSADACSRQLKQLAKYRTPDGTPVLHVKTRPIPRSVNQETGEIIEPHKEVWVGPGPIQHDAFGHVLATLAPDQAPKHGGKPDRNVCPEHPNAGVLRRTRNMRRITHECAHCQKILDTQVVPVGRESTEHLRSMAAPPDPIQHDAFAPETDEPMPQHAVSMDNHSGVRDLSGKMRHSPSPQSGYRPPPGWEDDRRRVYGQVYREEAAS